MLIIKRLLVWAIETTSCVFLIGLGLTLLFTNSADQAEKSCFERLTFLSTVTFAVFMVGSGYLLTTAIAAGSRLRNLKQWIYPLVVSALFVVHVQFFASGWDIATKTPVQVIGASVSFFCAFIGNWLVRRWSAVRLD